MSDAIPIDRFLREAGFDTSEAGQVAREALEVAGLTRPGKVNLSLAKVQEAGNVLALLLAQSCERCAHDVDAAGRQVVIVSGESCPRCRGSDNRWAVLGMLQAAEKAGVRHLLVLGGSSTTEATFLAHLGSLKANVKARFIYGDERNWNQKEAAAALRWADVVAVMASTEVAHSTTNLFTRHPTAPKVPMITVPHRGVAALARALTEHFERRAS